MKNNFKYCVYLTIYSGNKLPPFYIGSSSVDNIISNGYHGSVKSKKYKEIWDNELLINPHFFKTIIISYHNLRKDATVKECVLQKSLNVVKSPLYINMAFANKEFNSGNKWAPDRFEKIAKPYSFKNQDGIIHTGSNIRKFCRDNGLHPHAMRMVRDGIYDNHKGWMSTDANILKLVSIKKTEIAIKRKEYLSKRNKENVKSFSFVDPTGKIHTGKNISEFARMNNLHPGHMQEVISGVAKSHKGWTKYFG